MISRFIKLCSWRTRFLIQQLTKRMTRHRPIGTNYVLVHSDMRQLPVPNQLFPYADAYSAASVVLCQKMMGDTSSCTWPNGAVVLMLAAHAVELFLKGVLLKRNPAMDVWSHGHSIDSLSKEYKSQFPDQSFTWDIPFASPSPVGEWIEVMQGMNPDLTVDEIKRLRPAPPPDPSILYRYPVGRDGQEWRGLFGFEPHSFLLLLSQVRSDFERIKSQLA